MHSPAGPARSSADEPQLTARQQRARDTRARLFTAAAELFDANGYHQTTVEQIVRRANVAKGTFFLHFATKDAVIAELIRAQVKGARKARARVLAERSGPVERLRATVLGLGRMAGVSRTLSRATLAAALANPELGEEADTLVREVYETMIDDVRDAQQAGALVADPDAETIAQVLIASYLGAALHFTSSPRARPLVEMLTPILEANLAAFAPRAPATPAAGAKRGPRAPLR